MAFRGNGDRAFIGELTDPLPVTLDAKGKIRVELMRRNEPEPSGLSLTPEIRAELAEVG